MVRFVGNMDGCWLKNKTKKKHELCVCETRRHVIFGNLSPFSILVRVGQWLLVSILQVMRRLQVVHICNLCSTISVHVAQWLEHLTGHPNVTGCTHM